MNISNKNNFLDNCLSTLSSMYDNFDKLPIMSFKSECHCENTALIIVDVINGFVREGILHSKRVEDIISDITELLENCNNHNIKSIAFADCHTENSTEFNSFPKHCINGESESEVVTEIRKIGGYTLIEKNSTNGFHTPEFQKFLTEKNNINNFIICGDCTDICVMNFCLTLKTYFDQQNKNVSITVPINMIETYELGIHNADLMNVTALQLMQNAGIKLIKEIDYND